MATEGADGFGEPFWAPAIETTGDYSSLYTWLTVATPTRPSNTSYLPQARARTERNTTPCGWFHEGTATLQPDAKT